MDVISWFWHPMALYILVLGMSVLVPVVGIVVVFALILRGSSRPSTLPPLPGEQPNGSGQGEGFPQPDRHPMARPAAPVQLEPGRLPTAAPAGGHIIPQPTGSSPQPPRDPWR